VVTNKEISPLILAVEGTEETRDGIEKLLKADGYRVESARTVEDAILRAKREPPDLLLISLPGTTVRVIQLANRIRQEAGLLKEKVPVVMFCIEEVAQGEEVAIEGNIYLTRLDNFNQLRAFLRRLLINKPSINPVSIGGLAEAK